MAFPGKFILHLCCGFSGCAALIYEILWIRLISLQAGFGARTISLVVAVFLGGLALGSAVWTWSATAPLPRWACPLRERTLLLFAALELFVGAFGLGSWFIMKGPMAASLLAMLAPTAAMGAVFPLLAGLSVLSKGPDSSPAAGTLYGANTLGAVLGVALAGYLLPPVLGVRGTLAAAAALNWTGAAWGFFGLPLGIS